MKIWGHASATRVAIASRSQQKHGARATGADGLTCPAVWENIYPWVSSHAWLGSMMERTANWMRKFGIKYARMHPHPKTHRMAFVEVKNDQEWNGVIETYYG